MSETHHLLTVLALLAAAIVAVALFARLRASPVLGYLAAGALIGPGGFDLVEDVEGMRAVAEIGVVFLLFIIGLELSWERLRAMRKQAFAVGFAQVVITTAGFAWALSFFGFPTETAIVVGGGLALSSTALVLQLIAERNQKASQLGRLALAVLLVQDLAVVPLLVLVPTLANPTRSVAAELGIVSLKAIVALLIIVIAGRLLLRPLYRLIASLGNPEIFTALTLLIALGTGWFTSSAGLSLPLGAFMAGLLLAETEYRHQVEADVMPYKGLFLGLFFMSVGMSVNVHALAGQFPLIIMLALLLMSVKCLIILFLSRLLGFGRALSIEAGLLLSQGGEFAFVVFGLAANHDFIPDEIAQILVAVVTLSMAVTPLAAALGRRVSRKMGRSREHKAELAVKETSDLRDHVIILGFGRVGQTIAKLLSAEGINYVALDMGISTVAKAKKLGLPVYFGDGSNREVLHALGVERASAAIVTVNEPNAAERMVQALRAAQSHLPIIARGRDLGRVMALEAAGANVAISEMFETSLQLGGALLKHIGIKDQEITRIVQIFRDRDYALARGTLEAAADEKTPYGKMLTFQNASVIQGGTMEEDWGGDI